MDNIREGNLLGGPKVIVGNVTEDLILETLGKVYIRSGKNFILLNEIIKKVLELADGLSSGNSDITSQVVIIDNISELGIYPDGTLVFDKLTQNLFMMIDGLPILLVEAKTNNSDKYVKRTGDSMTGQLILMYDGGPSLTVKSTLMVPNLNADRLDDYHVSLLAIKAKDETITGNWTHDGRTTFNLLVIINNNVSQQGGGYYTNNYIGTKQFIPGFQGVGWCVLPDDTGYTLTVDNLVVRKAMEVFELIVNKINATNGSMWVADYAKVFAASRVEIVDSKTPLLLSGNWFVKYLPPKEDESYYSIVKVNASHLSNSLELKSGLKEDDALLYFEEIDYIVFTKIFYTSDPAAPTSENTIEFDLFENLPYITGITDKFEPELILAKFKAAPESYKNKLGTLQPNVTRVNNKYVYKYDTDIWTYYRYFGVPKSRIIGSDEKLTDYRLPGLFMVEFESEDCIPTLWEGDLVRCLKFYEHGIRYYDALVGKSITTQLQESENFYLPIFTITGSTMGNTEVYYNEEDNTTVRILHTELLKETTYTVKEDENAVAEKDKIVREKDDSASIELIRRGDLMVRIGNVYNPRRQGALYLTSSENFSPYLNMISEVNRPDYSVIYYLPKYKKFSALLKVGGEEGNETMKYRDFYLQTNDFSVAYNNQFSSKFRDIYANYVTRQMASQSSVKPSIDNMDIFEECNNYLTNSLKDNTKYTSEGPVGLNYSPLSRYLYASDKENEPYINPKTFVDSKETTKFKGITYCIGAI